MAGHIAIFEGYTMPRRRRKSRSRRGGSQRTKFARAARFCARRRKGSFRACMKRQLKGKGRRRSSSRRRRRR